MLFEPTKAPRSNDAGGRERETLANTLLCPTPTYEMSGGSRAKTDSSDRGSTWVVGGHDEFNLLFAIVTVESEQEELTIDKRGDVSFELTSEGISESN